MKKTSFLTAAFLMLFLSTNAQDSTLKISAEDYERATKFLRFNTNSLVDRANVRPVWLEDGRFWYRINTAEGTEYVLVNPKDGSKQTASSREQLLPQQTANDSPNISRNEILSPRR